TMPKAFEASSPSAAMRMLTRSWMPDGRADSTRRQPATSCSRVPADAVSSVSFDRDCCPDTSLGVVTSPPRTRRGKIPSRNLAPSEPSALSGQLSAISFGGFLADRCMLTADCYSLQPIHPLGRADVDRLFDLLPHDLLARLVEAQHGIVIH